MFGDICLQKVITLKLTFRYFYLNLYLGIITSSRCHTINFNTTSTVVPNYSIDGDSYVLCREGHWGLQVTEFIFCIIGFALSIICLIIAAAIVYRFDDLIVAVTQEAVISI